MELTVGYIFNVTLANNDLDKLFTFFYAHIN